MQEVRYMISDTARKVDVEAHVLRYWEEELEIPIARNEMGHRYYTPDNIRLLKNIKDLKEQGFQLRAIKLLLPQLLENNGDGIEQFFGMREELNFQVSAMGQEVMAKGHLRDKDSEQAVIQNDKEGQAVPQTVKGGQIVSQEGQMDRIRSQKVMQFQNIIKSAITEALEENNFALEEKVGDKVIKHVDYMLRMNEERDDERFKKLDEAIRTKQKVRKEVAVSKEEGGEKKSFFRRRKEKKNT